MRLDGIAGRVALVTGAASGIGRRACETLAALDARVAGLDLDAAAAPPGTLGVDGDVSDAGSVDAAFRTVEEALGPVELLVTSAGVFRPVAVEALPLDEWRRTIEINLTGTFLCAQRALPAMRRSGFGRIVTLSSSAGLDGGTEACVHYAASKGGVIALTKAIAKEVVGDGVLANVVAPRNIRTPMVAGMEGLEAPVGRMGEPDDVAAAIAFLCSAHAGYVSGEVLVLNGGWW